MYKASHIPIVAAWTDNLDRKGWSGEEAEEETLLLPLKTTSLHLSRLW
jgi:hypothetical protein